MTTKDDKWGVSDPMPAPQGNSISIRKRKGTIGFGEACIPDRESIPSSPAKGKQIEIIPMSSLTPAALQHTSINLQAMNAAHAARALGIAPDLLQQSEERTAVATVPDPQSNDDEHSFSTIRSRTGLGAFFRRWLLTRWFFRLFRL